MSERDKRPPPPPDFDEVLDNPEWTEEDFRRGVWGDTFELDNRWRHHAVKTLRDMADDLRAQADELDRQADLVADRPGARAAVDETSEPTNTTPHAAE